MAAVVVAVGVVAAPLAPSQLVGQDTCERTQPPSITNGSTRIGLFTAQSNHFFVTDPNSNQVIVLDAASETKVGEISVPGAYSLDDTLDHKTLYVGTAIGDLYTLDPVAMTVTNRYVGSRIGPSGFWTVTALVMADGRLALLGGTGDASLDGSPGFAIWNPADNSLTIGGL